MSTIHRTVATNYHISEDAILPKLITAAVPLVGTVVSLFAVLNLWKKMDVETHPGRMVRLIEVRNHYSIFYSINALTAVATLVHRMAIGVTASTPGIFLIIGFLAFVTWEASNVIRNNRLIEELQTKGMHPGMTAH